MKQYTGRTLDEVLNSIASEQGCQVQDITYNVLEEEKGGIFGLHKSITIEAFTSKDVKEFIFDYLGAYFTELNQGVAIEIIVEKDKEKEDELLYRVILDAENNAIIIGKNGQTLRAISTVLKAAVNATFKKRINLIVDVIHDVFNNQVLLAALFLDSLEKRSERGLGSCTVVLWRRLLLGFEQLFCGDEQLLEEFNGSNEILAHLFL